jgi:hypothetical protein
MGNERTLSSLSSNDTFCLVPVVPLSVRGGAEEGGRDGAPAVNLPFELCWSRATTASICECRTPLTASSVLFVSMKCLPYASAARCRAPIRSTSPGLDIFQPGPHRRVFAASCRDRPDCKITVHIIINTLDARAGRKQGRTRRKQSLRAD